MALGIASAGMVTLGLAALSPAIASDLPPGPPPQMLPARAPGVLPFNWGGLYAGLNVGGGFSDVSGVVFGGQLGYNWQVSQLVFGVETDIQFSSQDATSVLTTTATTLNDKQELDWFGTFRGRFGYVVFDRWLPYVTAGLAYGGRKASGTATGALTGPYSATDTSIGWAAGVGIDYSFSERWSARLEYLHVSLDGFSPTYALTGGTAAVSYGRLENDIVRGAVNYRILP